MAETNERRIKAENENNDSVQLVSLAASDLAPSGDTAAPLPLHIANLVHGDYSNKEEQKPVSQEPASGSKNGVSEFSNDEKTAEDLAEKASLRPPQLSSQASEGFSQGPLTKEEIARRLGFPNVQFQQETQTPLKFSPQNPSIQGPILPQNNLTYGQNLPPSQPFQVPYLPNQIAPQFPPQNDQSLTGRPPNGPQIQTPIIPNGAAHSSSISPPLMQAASPAFGYQNVPFQPGFGPLNFPNSSVLAQNYQNFSPYVTNPNPTSYPGAAFKQDRLVPQTQNDILLWLFTESPPELIPGNNSLGMAFLGPQKGEIPALGSPKHPKTEQLLYDSLFDLGNLGVHDISFFLSGDNPLDDVFVKSARPHMNPASTSSTSPSNTAESSSPKQGLGSPKTSSQSEENGLLLRHHGRENTAQNADLYIDSAVVEMCMSSVPQLTRELLERCFEGRVSLENRLSFYLAAYWRNFHPQFPILHRPSFSTRTCELRLLLAMAVLGSNYCQNEGRNAEFRFGLLITGPLRFSVFQSADFSLPVKLWVLQTLNLLEWLEKNFLSRKMHERAHLHHGTTVQLLRRLPLLGGNPSANKASTSSNNSADEEEVKETGDASSDERLYFQWVEAEAMKRATLMTFYADSMDYVKFRHNSQILFHQMQMLNLPCEDSLWEEDLGCLFRKLVRRQKKIQGKHSELLTTRNGGFLGALKQLLKPQKGDREPLNLLFTRKVLLAGLVSLMHQMQQADLQSHLLLGAKKNLGWQEVLTRAFDTWRVQNGPIGGLSASRSLSPMYHLAQIIGMASINHYDVAIFGGLPANQNVDTTLKDQGAVQRKLSNMWLRRKGYTDLLNAKSVIHCYILLWELVLGEEGSAVADFLARNDAYDSMYALSLATLVLWCYVFSIYGLESARYGEVQGLPGYELLSAVAAESAHAYLVRIRQEFLTYLRKENLHEEYSVHPLSGKTLPHAILSKYCDLLPRITNKQNISGLCFLVGTKLLESQSEVVRENARLIVHCGLRLVGKRSVVCEELFDGEV